VEAAKIMADFEFTRVTVKDLFKGVELEIYPAGRTKAYVSKEAPGETRQIQVACTIRNNTATTKLVYLHFTAAGTERFVKSYAINGGASTSDSWTFRYSDLGVPPYAVVLELKSNGTSYHKVSFTLYAVWWLETHAFMYGTEPDGENVDNACTISVSGQIESINPNLHAFLDLASATVEAKPKYPWEHSYWMIGGTKSTDNPASFTMTYNNYAYAYLCAPIPRWRALEDIDGDGQVKIFDVVAVARAYGSRPGDANWNQLADIDGDGQVKIFDVVRVTSAYYVKDEDLPSTLTVTAPTQAKVQTMTASAINFAAAAAVAMILSAFLKSIVRSLRR
jgi:hypothetical protein